MQNNTACCNSVSNPRRQLQKSIMQGTKSDSCFRTSTKKTTGSVHIKEVYCLRYIYIGMIGMNDLSCWLICTADWSVLLNDLYCWLICTAEWSVLLNDLYCWMICTADWSVLLNDLYCWMICTADWSVLLNDLYCWLICTAEWSVLLNDLYCWMICTAEWSVLLIDLYCWLICTAEWSVLFTKYCSGDKIDRNEMGWACSTYGGQQRCIQAFGAKTWRKDTTWTTQA